MYFLCMLFLYLFDLREFPFFMYSKMSTFRNKNFKIKLLKVFLYIFNESLNCT